MIKKGQAILIAALLLASPLFGVYLADMVGYHEPLDVAAELLGLQEAEWTNWTPFADYAVPGLPPELGYVVSGAIGVAAIFAIGYLLAKLFSKQGGRMA